MKTNQVEEDHAMPPLILSDDQIHAELAAIKRAADSDNDDSRQAADSALRLLGHVLVCLRVIASK